MDSNDELLIETNDQSMPSNQLEFQPIIDDKGQENFQWIEDESLLFACIANEDISSSNSEQSRQMTNLDEIIFRLTNDYKDKLSTTSRPIDISVEEVGGLCEKMQQVFLSEPTLLRLDADLYICGDIHGQFKDLKNIFKRCGPPSNKRYLFLGDYVDRGRQGADIMCLLFAYKLRYPEQMFLLRGNHECSMICKMYGFYDEVCTRWNEQIWKSFINCFDSMPLSALIADRVLCMHGGISPDLNSLSQIDQISRPCPVPAYGLMCDLLWSDPEKKFNGWGSNFRGISFTFGTDIVKEYCKKLNIDLICRAHQAARDGYSFFADGRLLTIFSAPNYCGDMDNDGCVLYISQTLQCKLTIFRPRRSPAMNRQKA